MDVDYIELSDASGESHGSQADTETAANIMAFGHITRITEHAGTDYSWCEVEYEDGGTLLARSRRVH